MKNESIERLINALTAAENGFYGGSERLNLPELKALLLIALKTEQGEKVLFTDLENAFQMNSYNISRYLKKAKIYLICDKDYSISTGKPVNTYKLAPRGKFFIEQIIREL